MKGPWSELRALLAVAVLWCPVAGGCASGAPDEQREIRAEDIPRIQRVVREDLERGVRGVQQAADRIHRGFLVEDPERRAREIRGVLERLRVPPRGIDELMISPISFVAAVGADGHVICRDATPDPMMGFDAGAAFPVVRRALDEGVASYALVQFPSSQSDQPPSHTVLYAAPSRHEGRVVGAVIAGTPLWRTAQRLGRQLQADHAADMPRGMILWVYLYEGDVLHHHGTPPDLEALVPSPAARAEGLRRSPGGFTADVAQFGRWYAYGVVPLPRLGPDVGAVVFRSDPP